MSDEQPLPIRFATQADREAWERDFVCFGSAVLTAEGKHVPLRDLYIDGNKRD